MVIYTQCPLYPSPTLVGQASIPPQGKILIRFVRNPSLRSAQKYQPYITHTWDCWFCNSSLSTAIPHRCWPDVGTQSLGIGVGISSESTPRPYIYLISTWTDILLSTVWQLHLCWASGTVLQGRILRCESWDQTRISKHLGTIYRKWRESPPSSVSNGSIFGTSQFYMSVCQQPYHIKNRRFSKWTAQLSSPLLIRQFRAWYVKYAAFYGASCGGLRFSISSKLGKRWGKNFVFGPKMTVFSKPLAEF